MAGTESIRIERPAGFNHVMDQALLQRSEDTFVEDHFDRYSTPSMGDETTEDGAVTRPDFLLGDLDGRSCASARTETVAAALRDMRYRVVLNDPYKGQALVRRYFDPATGRHSLQIEINRVRYMDEERIERIERNEGYERLKGGLGKLCERRAAICTELEDQAGRGGK